MHPLGARRRSGETEWIRCGGGGAGGAGGAGVARGAGGAESAGGAERVADVGFQEL